MQPYQTYVNTVISAPTPQYPYREFYLQRLLGSGGEGGVYLAKQSNGGSVNKVALKLQRSIKDSEKSFLENIIHYQNTYENPNSHQYYPSYIIRIYEIILWNNTFIIVMELGKSNLYDYLKNNRTIQLREKGIICSEISKSIHLLHYFGFAHRDIKPENYIQVGNQWKLCDFGLAKAHKDPFKTKNVGSICFTAPEVLDDGESYSEKVDIWSLGCVFYEIIEGKELFSELLGDNLEQIKELILTSNKTKKHIGKNYIQEKINDLKISESWKKALFNMLQHEPSHRYSAQELISAIVPSIVPQMPSEKFIQKDLPFQIQGWKNKFNNLVYQTQKPLQSSALQNKIIQNQTEQVLGNQVQQNELNQIQQTAKDSCQRPQEIQNQGYQVQNVDQSRLIKTLQVSSNNQFNVQKQTAPLVKQEEEKISNTQFQEDIPQKLGTVLQQEEQTKIQNQLNSNKIQNLQNEQQSFLQNQFAYQGDQQQGENVTQQSKIQKTPPQHEQLLEQKEINLTNQLQDDQKNELQNPQQNHLEQVQGLEQTQQQDCNETNISLSQYEQDILNFAQFTANSAHNIIISHNNKNIKVTDFGQDQQKTMKDLGVIIDKLNDQLKVFLQNY